MPVYVDNEQIAWRGKKWCHLVADNLTFMIDAGTRDHGRHCGMCEPARVKVGQYFDGFDRDT